MVSRASELAIKTTAINNAACRLIALIAFILSLNTIRFRTQNPPFLEVEAQTDTHLSRLIKKVTTLISPVVLAVLQIDLFKHIDILFSACGDYLLAQFRAVEEAVIAGISCSPIYVNNIFSVEQVHSPQI